MGFAYQVKDQEAVHFVTFTVHQWADVFTRPIYIDTLLESLRYCQKEKGLEIFAWVIMSNHCHLILRAKNENLSDVIRDLRSLHQNPFIKQLKLIYRKVEKIGFYKF